MANMMEVYQLLQSFFMFHTSSLVPFVLKMFQLCYTSFKKLTFIAFMNAFQLLSLNGLQLYFQYQFSTSFNKHKKLTFLHDLLACSSLPTTSSLENPNFKALISSTCDARLFLFEPCQANNLKIYQICDPLHAQGKNVQMQVGELLQMIAKAIHDVKCECVNGNY